MTISENVIEAARESAPEVPWLIYSREHNAWWRANASGYTNEIANAGRYSKVDAEQKCGVRDEQDGGSPSEVAVIAPEAADLLTLTGMDDGWRPIEEAPKDGTEIFLFHPGWDAAQIAKWDWVEGPDEDGSGGYCLWHLRDDDAGAMGDGLLWPEEEWKMPTLWQPLPAPPRSER